jgi:hypothetical protein
MNAVKYPGFCQHRHPMWANEFCMQKWLLACCESSVKHAESGTSSAAPYMRSRYSENQHRPDAEEIDFDLLEKGLHAVVKDQMESMKDSNFNTHGF